MKTKALISFVVTVKLICVFVFAYADCWFSHEAAHIFLCQMASRERRDFDFDLTYTESVSLLAIIIVIFMMKIVSGSNRSTEDTRIDVRYRF